MFGKNSFIPRAGIARTGAKVRTAYRRSNMAMLLDCSAAPLLNYHSVLGLAATVLIQVLEFRCKPDIGGPISDTYAPVHW